MFAKIISVVLTINLLIVSIQTGHRTKKSIDTVIVPAIDRHAELGQLYDYRRDQFIATKIFKQGDIAPLVKHVQRKKASGLKMTMDDSLESVLKIMDIPDSTKLSLLAGLVAPHSDPGLFINGRHLVLKPWNLAIVQQLVTDYEEIDVNDRRVKDLINETFISDVAVSDATHVVVGVERGIDVVMTADFKDLSVVGDVELMVRQLSEHGNDDGNDTIEYWKKKLENVEVTHGYLADFERRERYVSANSDLISLIVALNNLPQKIDKARTAKKYTLVPIERIIATNKNNYVMVNWNSDLVNEFVRLYDQMNNQDNYCLHWLNDFKDERYSKYLDMSELNKSEDFWEQRDFHYEYQAALADMLFRIRSGREDPDKMNNLLDSLRNYFTANKLSLEDSLTPIKKQYDFVKYLLENDVLIICKNQSLSKMISENSDKDIYVLFYDDSIFGNNYQEMITFKKMLDNKDKFASNTTFVALNYDVVNNIDQLNSNKSTKISVYVNGNLSIDDYRG